MRIKQVLLYSSRKRSVIGSPHTSLTLKANLTCGHPRRHLQQVPTLVNQVTCITLVRLTLGYSSSIWSSEMEYSVWLDFIQKRATLTHSDYSWLRSISSWWHRLSISNIFLYRKQPSWLTALHRLHYNNEISLSFLVSPGNTYPLINISGNTRSMFP